MRGMLNFIAGSIVGLLCFWAGWVYAHQAIATECKRLGGFFVGPVTFKMPHHRSARATPATARAAAPARHVIDL